MKSTAVVVSAALADERRVPLRRQFERAGCDRG
jgi:hypothetical protein